MAKGPGSPVLRYSGSSRESKTKMAAQCFTADEVREEVLKYDESDGDDMDGDDVGDVEDDVKDGLEKLLKLYDGGDRFDGEFFRGEAIGLLLPLARLAKRIGESTEETESRSKVACLLSTHVITTGSVLDTECRLWLTSIHRRFTGRVAIRRPYFAEIHRQIPYAIVTAIAAVIERTPQFRKPIAYSSKNKKGHVLSFTSLEAVVLLFSLLTSIKESDVKLYFVRRLRGMKRNGHLVKLIVDERKDFALYYKHNTGQLSIQFHYGEWNKHDFPQHPCQIQCTL